jgi:predicted Abi (CAAX) family protease
MAPSLAKEGVRDAPVWTTLTCLFAGAFRVRGRETSVSSTFNACRETSRVPASARQSQNVPVSYPRGIGISPLQATLYAHLQGFCASLWRTRTADPLSMKKGWRVKRGGGAVRRHGGRTVGGC